MDTLPARPEATPTIRATTSTVPIEVLGRDTCEDTSIVRSRLAALGVPFTYGNSDVDAETGTRIRALNGGHLVTPTVVIGDTVTTEPSLEDTDRLAEAAGHRTVKPVATQLHGVLVETAIPRRHLPAPGLFGPQPHSPWVNRQAAVFLPHDAACLACFGYARQLARQATALGEADASVAVVVPGADPPDHWEPSQLEGATVLLDTAAGWRQEVADAIAVPASGALVLMLDRYLAPRVVSHADDAGGLVTPTEVTDWLRFTVLDCAECSTELPWP